jgi:uncharacterized protein YdhG (YjbR/CyaY superfamily)
MQSATTGGKKGNTPVKDVDAYLEAAPEEARKMLVQLRKIVKASALEAEEGISYGMPFYKHNGALLGFGAFKNHIGFFPGTIIEEFTRELRGYETSKGTVRFPIGRPIPVGLVKKIIKARVARNENKRKYRK